METSKQVASMVLETVKSSPYVVMVAIFATVVLPGVVKLASMLPGAN
jgi:hypothetical protein